MQKGIQIVSSEEAGVNPTTTQRCRYCRRRLDAADERLRRFWPFCSDRCKMAELGLWFEERYVIGRPTGEVADNAAAPPAIPKPGSVNKS